ncbi:hypothetical protein QBC39DRAFT_139467 [Podospora conica]|nr:hypothetical protein QBC39DRAFT_139467 [Schizothecium conicum]
MSAASSSIDPLADPTVVGRAAPARQGKARRTRDLWGQERQPPYQISHLPVPGQAALSSPPAPLPFVPGKVRWKVCPMRNSMMILGRPQCKQDRRLYRNTHTPPHHPSPWRKCVTVGGNGDIQKFHCRRRSVGRREPKPRSPPLPRGRISTPGTFTADRDPLDTNVAEAHQSRRCRWCLRPVADLRGLACPSAWVLALTLEINVCVVFFQPATSPSRRRTDPDLCSSRGRSSISMRAMTKCKMQCGFDRSIIMGGQGEEGGTNKSLQHWGRFVTSSPPLIDDIRRKQISLRLRRRPSLFFFPGRWRQRTALHCGGWLGSGTTRFFISDLKTLKTTS